MDNRLYALNPDGTKKWHFTTGDHIPSSPAIGFDGTIYIGSVDNNLYAINPDGTEKWHFTADSGIRWSSPTIDHNGTVYIGSLDNKFYAINPDGTEKWNYKIDDKVDSDAYDVESSAAIGSDGTIYFGCNNGKLYALNQDGTKKWDFTYGVYSGTSPTIGPDDTIYIGSWSNERLYAINPDGTEKWSYITGAIRDSSPTIGSDGTIYTGAGLYYFYAINPNGTKKWHFTTGDHILSSASIGSDGTIFVGSLDNNLYAINPNGTEKWRFLTGDRIASSPVIDSDGTIYIGSDDSKLYAIGEGSFPPIADAGFDQIVNEGDLVQFNGSASYQDSGTIEIYEWDFDASYDSDSDGNQTNDVDATGPTPTHIYGDDGIYTVTLKVTDDASKTDLDQCNVSVNNVAPTITLMMTYPDDEGSRVTFEAEAIDPGSDDVTFSWELEYGPSVENTYYNDLVGPEPFYDPGINEIKTPLGNFPFQISDVKTHVYGDNYDYTINLTVTDDDGGESTYTTTVTVNNLAPSIIEINIPSQVDEGSLTLFEVLTSDQGSDDLTFTWDFELGPTITNVHYNDGVGLDPYPSPWGDFPFDVWDTLNHAYGDDGVYALSLSIEDDDGGITTYTTDINVQNVAPTIDLVTASGGDEGAAITFSSTSTDPGSDDLTFTWNWGDGTEDTMNIHYNDGTEPDPLKSPLGVYPFTTTDTVSHIYGDDGDYTITLTVEDDDGGLATYTTTVTIDNVAPTIEPFGPFTVDEFSLLEITAISTDPGSDDLTFTWEFEMGPTTTNVYYNDGVDPDPYPSPLGTYPYSSPDSVEHTYGDNGIYPVTLTVSDDDGGITTFTTNITVNNVAPTIATMEAYMYVNFSLRVAGEKYHSVGIHLYEDDVEIWNAQVTREPGNPDEQAAALLDFSINLGSKYCAIVDYIPNDPRINGNVWGGNPVWIDLEFQDGTTERLHHTFNVRQSDWDSDHWNHIDPWEVDLTGKIYRHDITFEALASDPGSDDLTFVWDFGDGGSAGPNTYFNNGISPDLFPSPEINPMNSFDSVMHAYTSLGSYTITLTIVDDDGGIAITTFTIILPG
jgi:outer membrane protein assembly factor BamB